MLSASATHGRPCVPSHSMYVPLTIHSKENTVLRASLDPLMVSVIPNAVVAENFRPLHHPAYSNDSSHVVSAPHHFGPNDIITIVVVSRLFQNKGTDLLTAAIPRILAAHPNVRFIIAGSGPKA